MSFAAVQQALRDALVAPGSATVAAAETVFHRAPAVRVTRGALRVGAGVPTIRIDSDDEDPITEGPDAGAMGGGLRCRRLVEIELVVPLREHHVDDLEALADAVYADLHHQGIAGAIRVDYAGSRYAGADETTKNEARRTVAFWVLYERS